MKFHRKGIFAVSALIVVASSPTFASTVVSGSCTSVASAAGCLFSGNINGNTDAGNANSFLNAQNAYNLYNNDVLSANPDIQLLYLGDTDAGFPGTFTGAGGLSGTWDLTAGLLADFVAVKSAKQFRLYQINPANLGNWSTAGLSNKHGGQQELSHLVFFGSQAPAVPEPATWLMLLAGFGFIGFEMRRRNAVVAFA